jgi:FAD/FMN-containing dehydrogenase/Fe-S oxidoreductase
MLHIASQPNSELLARQLRGLLKGNVLHDRGSRLLFATDASIYRIVPLLVVQPIDCDDVVRTVLFANETQIPIAPRGAGTGLAGESLTTGIVIDFSRFMTRIESESEDASVVVAEAGVILDSVSAARSQTGWAFGPDPSSASRATIGGSIGNNATGAHSLRYGYCADHVEQLQVVLASGEIINIDRSTKNELTERLYRSLAPQRGVIEANWPKLKRNRAGYNLLGALNSGQSGSVDLVRLLAGSEGTLGIITKAKLRLVRRPTIRLVLQANFLDSLNLMAESLPTILKYDPAAVELMDGMLLKLAKNAYPHLADRLPPQAEASLLIEFDGEHIDEAAGRLVRCQDELKSLYRKHIELRRIDDPVEQAQHFAARKRAVPLLFRDNVMNKPVPAIEDIAVPPEKMAAFISSLQQLFRKHDLKASFYAHAGPGELHIRPFLDLRLPEHRETLVQLTREAYQIAWQFGGTISGEHGVGILRSWALQKQYGPAYDLMIEVKEIFDPENILNPGKIVTEDADLPTHSLRADLKPTTGRASGTALDWGTQDPFQTANLCNGCGECKACSYDQLMCPSFRAQNDEALTPRARASILREYLAGNLTDHDLQSYPANLSLDLCLLCGNCFRECPSGVDIPSLVIEGRARRNKATKLTVSKKLFYAYTDRFLALTSKAAPLVNRLSDTFLFRRILEQTVGLHPAWAMPKFVSLGGLRKLRRLIVRYQPENPKYRAVWFLDVVPRYHNMKLAEAFVKVCAKNGIRLIIPAQRPSGITKLVYGHIDSARRIADYNLKKLLAAIKDADLVLCLEPTATLTLKNEYISLIRDERTEAIANATFDATAFLLQLHQSGQLNTEFKPISRRVAYHCPCHMRLLKHDNPGLELIKLIPSLRADALPAQCCGLAGTFGLQTDKYQMAMDIAEGLKTSIEQLRPDATCSECSSCRMQLQHISRLPSVHPIQLLAQGYDR